MMTFTTEEKLRDEEPGAGAVEEVRNMRINHLVVKPELRCTAKCPTCHYRRALHRKALQQRLLTIEEWKDFFVEISGLGVSRLDISGGEPMLYPQLPEMISAGKQRGWRVQLNSNGSLFSLEAAARLLDAGLDRAMISLYSAHPAIHDAMRQDCGRMPLPPSGCWPVCGAVTLDSRS